MGLNYALILTAWGFAALVGPILVARAKDMTGSFAGMLPVIALVLLGAVILPFLTRNPTRRAPRRVSFGHRVYESLNTIPSGEFR
jgi:MFS-type transporter involved in bile tolerance (Atg22 family)